MLRDLLRQDGLGVGRKHGAKERVTLNLRGILSRDEGAA